MDVYLSVEFFLHFLHWESIRGERH